MKLDPLILFIPFKAYIKISGFGFINPTSADKVKISNWFKKFGNNSLIFLAVIPYMLETIASL